MSIEGRHRVGAIRSFFRSITAERWAALGAIAAAISAGLSYCQIRTTNSELMTPYRAALYSVKVASFTDYAKAGSRYTAALHEAYSALAFDVGAPGGLDRMPDSQVQLAAKSVHFLIEKQSDYFAAADGSKGVWSPNTLGYIDQAYLHAVDASRCFIDVGQRTGELVPVNWSRVRDEAKKSCPDVLNGMRILCFQQAQDLAIEMMKEEIGAADLDLKPYSSAKSTSKKQDADDAKENVDLTLPDGTLCPKVLPGLLDKPVVETDPTLVTPDGRTILR